MFSVNENTGASNGDKMQSSLDVRIKGKVHIEYQIYGVDIVISF